MKLKQICPKLVRKIGGEISLIETHIQKSNEKDDCTEQLFVITSLIDFFKYQSLQNKGI